MIDDIRNLQLAVNAAKRILVNIAGSDFVSECGSYAAYNLRSYRGDMARDIYIEINGGVEPTDEQLTWMLAFADWVYDGIYIGD